MHSYQYIQVCTFTYRYGASRSLHGQVSVHMQCFHAASDSECRSSEAVFRTAHCFIKVLIALVNNRKSSQAIFNLAFASAFR